MSDLDVLRLLIINEPVGDAEKLVSILRNSGLAVRPKQVDDLEQLNSILKNEPIDAIVFGDQKSELTIRNTSEVISKGGKDIPIITLVSSTDDEKIIENLNSGVRTVVHRKPIQLVQSVFKKELSDLVKRRRLRRLEQNLRESERRCNSLLDSSQDSISYIHEGMHVYANPAYLEMFGYNDFEDVEGLSILDIIASESVSEFKKLLRKLNQGGTPPKNLELKGKKSNGNTFEALIEFSAASIEGEPCHQLVIRDQSMNPELAKELSNLRTQDLLTGLANRQYFMEDLDASISESINDTKTQNGLLLLEVDNFSQTVKQIGISGTDIIIGDLAEFLKDTLKDHDLAARYSDHSFAVISRGRSIDELEKLATMCQEKISRHLTDVGDKSLGVTVSIGLVAIGEDSNAVELVSNATTACHKAQASGGNQIHVHNPVADEEKTGNHQQHWVKLLKSAIKEDKFLLLFQPIISLQGEPGEQYEVLLRMRGPKDEDIHPNFFIKAAEQEGMVSTLDKIVIKKIIELIAQHKNKGQLRFFVKLSEASLCDQTLLRWLANSLKAQQVSGQNIIFEIPESKVVTNMKPAQTFIAGLKQLRCGFALEQFGSGLNSFQLLEHLNVEYIKIDRSFMVDLVSNEEHQEKIKDITKKAQLAGKIAIAEHIEDAGSMSVLWQTGINFVMGNFLQEPQREMNYDFNT